MYNYIYSFQAVRDDNLRLLETSLISLRQSIEKLTSTLRRMHGRTFSYVGNRRQLSNSETVVGFGDHQRWSQLINFIYCMFLHLGMTEKSNRDDVGWFVVKSNNKIVERLLYL